MKKVEQKHNYLLLIKNVIVCSTFAVMFYSCAPSIRFSSAVDSTTTSRYVPADWDYRKNYNIPQQRLLNIIQSYIGTPYKRGGMSRNGTDCSGFVNMVYGELNRARLPRSSAKMFKLGKTVSKDKLQIGDLVFFTGGKFKGINHVGIYVGNGRFAHASSTRGVIYSDIEEEYYRQRYAGARRLF